MTTDDKHTAGEMAKLLNEWRASVSAMNDIRYRLLGEAAAIITSQAKEIVVLREVLEEIAYETVVRVRGSNDVPAFDLCVKAEMHKMLEKVSSILASKGNEE